MGKCIKKINQKISVFIVCLIVFTMLPINFAYGGTAPNVKNMKKTTLGHMYTGCFSNWYNYTYYTQHPNDSGPVYRDPTNQFGDGSWRCYPWGKENKEILDFYFFITNLRKANKVFAEGKYRCLIHDKEVFVYERFDENERIIMGVNLSQNEISLKLKEDMIEYTNTKKGSIFNIEKEGFLVLLKSSQS